MKNLSNSIATVVRSRVFFVVVLVLFVVEAMWIALSARYPMAFDEEYHLGIIRLYAHQVSPLFAHQPGGSAPFGALTRDPSYLYHWLMSFPYRWLHGQVSEQATIIALRLLDVAFFATGLALWRKVLLKTKAGLGTVHVALLFLVLVPVVPLLAGQINYDNLLMLLVPLNILLALRLRDGLQKKRLNPALLLTILSMGMLGSLVKFAYLPIFAAIAVYVLYASVRSVRSRRKLLQWTRKGWGQSPTKSYVALAGFVLSFALFVQMYGINIVRYHNITPQCGQVLSTQQCLAYGPWARNYRYAQSAHSVGVGNPVYFAGGWLYGMFQRSFFAINGPGGPASYANEPPLPLLTFAAVGVLGFGVAALWRFRREVLRGDPVLAVLLSVAGAYVLALVGRNYHDYLQLGHLVAINGRYLVLVMLPVMVALGAACQRMVARKWQGPVLILAVVLFLQGGGVLSFIHESNENWYWPHDDFALHLNQHAQQLIGPFIVDWPHH